MHLTLKCFSSTHVQASYCPLFQSLGAKVGLRNLGAQVKGPGRWPSREDSIRPSQKPLPPLGSYASPTCSPVLVGLSAVVTHGLGGLNERHLLWAVPENGSSRAGCPHCQVPGVPSAGCRLQPCRGALTRRTQRWGSPCEDTSPTVRAPPS